MVENGRGNFNRYWIFDSKISKGNFDRKNDLE
jgi:hypothetical protein